MPHPPGLAPIARLALAAAATLAAGCTTLTYEGPVRPDSEVATLVSERTLIATLNGRDVPYGGANFATLKVLPGRHAVGVRLNDSTLSRTAPPIVVNFTAEAGRTYVTRPVYQGDRWFPQIVPKD